MIIRRLEQTKSEYFETYLSTDYVYGVFACSKIRHVWYFMIMGVIVTSSMFVWSIKIMLPSCWLYIHQSLNK